MNPGDNDGGPVNMAALRRLNAPFSGADYSGCEEVGGIQVCKTCHRPRQTLLYGLLWPCTCECVQECHNDDSEALERRAEALARRAFTSPWMRSMTFASDDGRFGSWQMSRCHTYANAVAGGIDTGLLLFGPPDGGKTFMSCAIANHVMDAGMSVVMRSVPQLVMERDDLSGEDSLGPLMSCDLLVLDDLGAERSTSYAQEYVYAIVDGRYQRRRPMVVSTNLTREELGATRDVTSQRTYNRLLEVCLPVECDTGRRRSTRERYDAMEERMRSMAAASSDGGDARRVPRPSTAIGGTGSEVS